MRSFVLGAAVATLASASSSDGPRDQWRSEEELGELPLSAVSRLPDKPPRYQMNQSTIIMPCNNSGYMDPERTVGWSIIDFDWSNGKAIWTKQRPMHDEVVLQNQVKLSTSSSLGQTVWVYRGSMWAYPWYTSVRKTLEDPAYSVSRENQPLRQLRSLRQLCLTAAARLRTGTSSSSRRARGSPPSATP